MRLWRLDLENFLRIENTTIYRIKTGVCHTWFALPLSWRDSPLRLLTGSHSPSAKQQCSNAEIVEVLKWCNPQGHFKMLAWGSASVEGVVLRRVKRRGLASGAALFAARQGLAPDGIFRE
jgi:hypothetical protein